MLTDTNRRTVIRAMTGTCIASMVGRPAFSQGAPSSTPPVRPDPIDREQVQMFVQAAHGSLATTRAMLDREPRLIRATWDWGGGDFETALGGASHMGRRDIAGFLLERGAPMDLFAAAMLGSLPIVRAALDGNPSWVHVPGPHRIPLVAHARAGGAPAAAVLEYIMDILKRA